MAASSERRAIVIGAGMAGLAAAAALAGHFHQVIVLERDRLRPDASPRPGAPQFTQLHGLLGGGLRALCRLLPGFDRDLARAGAARIRFGLERPHGDPGLRALPAA
jgi:glycine/D-amino acid oxidase-like deaminating enzyme